MPAPIFNLPIHTIEQARALAGLIRAYIDDQCPSDNDGDDWQPDPEFEGICAIAAHLDAGIAGATAGTEKSAKCGGRLAYETYGGAIRAHRGGVYKARCLKCDAERTNDGAPQMCSMAVATETDAQYKARHDAACQHKIRRVSSVCGCRWCRDCDKAFPCRDCAEQECP